MGVAMAIGLFNGLGSVAMVPTHVWDAVPGDVVSSVVLAAAAATAAGVGIKEYRLEEPESLRDPLIVHAGEEALLLRQSKIDTYQHTHTQLHTFLRLVIAGSLAH